MTIKKREQISCATGWDEIDDRIAKLSDEELHQVKFEVIAKHNLEFLADRDPRSDKSLRAIIYGHLQGKEPRAVVSELSEALLGRKTEVEDGAAD